MYKILTQTHFNYKFKKIMLKNIYIQRLSDCLAVKVKILDGMKKKHCMPWKTRTMGNKLKILFGYEISRVIDSVFYC